MGVRFVSTLPVQGSAVSRRGLLAAGLGAGAALAAGAAPAAAAPRRRRGPGAAGPGRRAVAFLDAMTDAHERTGPIRLPQSYADELGLYTTGFTYDAALAALAYLADGRPGSVDRAGRLARALVWAQQNDPHHSDGRLRQAYAVGPYTRNGVEQPYGLVRGDGTANVGGPFGFVGSGTGELAWAGIALCAAYQRIGDAALRAAAVRLARWIVNTCRVPGGFLDGLDRGGRPVRYLGTARHAVLAAFFDHLETATDDHEWHRHKVHANRFARSMFSADRGGFRAGRPVDADEPDRGHFVLESQTLGYLGLPEHRHRDALDLVDRRLIVEDTAGRRNSALRGAQRFVGTTISTLSRTVDENTPIEGGTVRPDRYGVWLEGTAQYAVALHAAGDRAGTREQLDTLEAAQEQLGVDQHVGDRPIAGGGLVAATSPLHVGYLDSGYYPYLHVAATSWYVLALTGHNPLTVRPWC
ncbi:hypothetical protein GCM10010123_17620 [Pilimelia anulata]|uniref:Tat pathway signal sequence domain protein n=1 Tax=Pilimelia anulata TaxID=53371 RepID=A0A8J3FBY8_9ACTN|nr:Tat pathway signal sequence domain protein [Pilimelia anulata]GGJ88496.1 hypothetical protein GCM10010123_17620 [Pilimelia anulata]